MDPTQTKEPVRRDVLEDGAVWHVLLDTPKANILDAGKVAALHRLFEEARSSNDLKCVLIEGAGPHFCYGASVQEHLPESCDDMLRRFHALFACMLETSVPTIAVVRGQCLGGGLELAAFCPRVVAAPDSRFGQPEIQLGVIAPVASIVLPERCGRGFAEDLLLTGRSVSAEEALRHGLVDAIADDPRSAALAWAREHLLPRSASSLRLALRAARASFAERFRRTIPDLEHLYLDELMQTGDALEGLAAFLAKRPPEWRNA